MLRHSAIADVQAATDRRRIAIDQVGIRALRHPLRVSDRSGEQHTVATAGMYVRLSASQKGTHMSRFVEVLHAHRSAVSVATFGGLLRELAARFDADAEPQITLTFPYFVTKTAPVSGARSLLDYEVTLSGELAAGRLHQALKIVIPVTSLCPCSKQISAYGAHNQRSHITVEVHADGADTATTIGIEDLIDLVEPQASSQLYAVLKRPDEKLITEHAYDNPKFVEDTIRDLASAFAAEPRIGHYQISVENFESIHNHSAYAQIQRPSPAKP